MTDKRFGCPDDFERLMIEVYRRAPEEVRSYYRALTTSAARKHGISIDQTVKPEATIIEFIHLISTAQNAPDIDVCRNCIESGTTPVRWAGMKSKNDG